eukprot:gnl/TRDRNA2_/TRDRNA2_165583_c0_seq3.p1 gnl/TRDRNA2_/TRDRNA2_165583_c0~~gnl/TRDRNA2_/TRDRNA2_165583_c0_seq3.p1  ORF type:complete len:172 (+),score=18.72 gnl/TRDRNA2_/TRDRNA2_165583_c0_seq3:65-580(+)
MVVVVEGPALPYPWTVVHGDDGLFYYNELTGEAQSDQPDFSTNQADAETETVREVDAETVEVSGDAKVGLVACGGVEGGGCSASSSLNASHAAMVSRHATFFERRCEQVIADLTCEREGLTGGTPESGFKAKDLDEYHRRVVLVVRTELEILAGLSTTYLSQLLSQCDLGC